MRIVILYDVDTETPEGEKRLRKLAEKCLNIGIRIQNSVYECSLDAAAFRKVTEELSRMIDPEKDSLRFYNLGNKYRGKIVHFGVGNDDVFGSFVY